MTADRFPMFPLGTVLFPRQFLPVHVFEPRYRQLTRHCLEGDRRFGVALIERGHEVGGDDVRVDVGTAAEIVQAAQLPDGRWLLEAVGRERLRVIRWLPDDPHPWAEVALLDEEVGDVDEALRFTVDQRLRRLLAVRAELGEPVAPSTVELSDDPVEASYETATLAQLTPLDALRVLEVRTAAERLGLLSVLLDDQIVLAEARLSP